MSSEDIPILRRPNQAPNRDEILVDEAALESFPASDPPCWTPTHAGTPSMAPPAIQTPRDLRTRLRNDVDSLALHMGESRTAAVAELLTTAFLDAGLHVVRTPVPGKPESENLEAIIRGSHDGEEIVVGATYDSVDGADLASGVAVLLSLARALVGRPFARTVRLVAFAKQGSTSYAERLRDQGITVRGMLSLDSVGFFADRHTRETLRLPLRMLTANLLKPWVGEFVAFVGDRGTGVLTEIASDAFKHGTRLESRSFTLPALLPLLSSSDSRSFARLGFPAVLITDTGPICYGRRHNAGEVSRLLNYDHMADLVFGLTSVVARLAHEEIPTRA